MVLSRSAVRDVFQIHSMVIIGHMFSISKKEVEENGKTDGSIRVVPCLRI